MIEVIAAPLTADHFAPFGDVIELGDRAFKINDGFCDRHHDLARPDIIDGSASISLFHAQTRDLPYQFDLVERHPLGSQAFIPMSQDPFLVIVAPDVDDRPGPPRAFVTKPGQGVQFHRNVWHGVLTPLHDPGLFAVIDRVGPGDNLEEYRLTQPYKVIHP